MQKIKSPVLVLTIICLLAVIAALITFLNSKSDIGQKDGLAKTLEENNIALEGGVSNEIRNLSGNLPAISSSDHLWGNLQNPVKMIIYSDFECPFCAEFGQTIKKVMENYQDKVVIVFRHRYLIFHSAALPAAEASECAAEQGKFWEMHDKLFEDAGEYKLLAEEFKKDASELGLDLNKFSQCLESEKYKEKIQNQSSAGKNAGASGTPTFFVGSEIYPGAFPFEDFIGSDGIAREGVKSIIERHLKR